MRSFGQLHLKTASPGQCDESSESLPRWIEFQVGWGRGMWEAASTETGMCRRVNDVIN